MNTVSPAFYKKLALLSAFLGIACCTVQVQAQQPTEIIWDKYGVPHIYGRTTDDMYYAYGWSQMHNHANLLLKLYGQARGRAAEYWGDTYLPSDQQIHLFNLPDLARQQYARQDPTSKAIIESFVKGINAYAQAHPEALDPSVKQVLPVTPYDLLAHNTRVICLEFLARRDIATATQLITPGSNSYAIAPSKSASKKAMLVTNPHLPWGDFFLFFEAHLTAPGFNAYGVSLIGQPVLNIAFNDHLGWTHTVNTIDASDRYELTLQDGGYLLDGTVQPFEKRTVPLKVRQADGSLKMQNLALTYARHGPVIGEKNGKAYAIRIAGLQNVSAAAQYHKMASATTIHEFEAALKMMQSPMFNVIYADKGGNILYLFNGNVPKRSEGDWAFWNGTVDGRSSKYIWTQYHSYNELPKVVNPPTGFVQNANDSPWTSTYPMVLKPSDYPPYMAPQVMSLRPQRAVNLIKNDASITFDELVGYKLNTGMEAADRFLDDLQAAVQQYPDTAAQRAIAVLQKWDKASNTDSRGAVLFAHWFDKLEPGMFSVQWNPNQPVTTPDGLKDPQKAVSLLVKAAAEVQKMYGALDVPWGEVNRFRVGTYDVPANGGPEKLGVFRTMYFSPNRQNHKSYALAGDTYVAVTEFGDNVHAQVLLSYGNATQPGSKHIGDQLPLLSQKKLRPALLEHNEILQQMEKRETLSIAK